LINLNTAAGVGFILTAMYGVWDGVRGYRRRSRELEPYVMTSGDGASFGISGAF
jgi:hypothetical protein